MHTETHTWVQGSTSEWERSHKQKTCLFGQDVSLQISFLVTCELSKRNYPIANNRVPFTAPQTEPVAEAKMCCHIPGFFVMDRQTIFSTIRSSSWVRMARSGQVRRQREDTSETTVLWWKVFGIAQQEVEQTWNKTESFFPAQDALAAAHVTTTLPATGLVAWELEYDPKI